MPQPHTGELVPSRQQLWTFDSFGNLIVANQLYTFGVPDPTQPGPGQPLVPGTPAIPVGSGISGLLLSLQAFKPLVTSGGDWTAAFAAWVSALQLGAGFALAGAIPAGDYDISAEALNWMISGLVIFTAGAANTKITQQTDNVGIVQVAGETQRIGGLTLAYARQQISAHTGAIGITFGDDTVGSCFLSTFDELRVWQAQTGMAINPAVTSVAGLFSCDFGTIEIFGWSESAINFNCGNGAGAGGTGCNWRNIYCHNNFDGTPAISAAACVLFRNWSETGSIGELNIEKFIASNEGLAVAETGNMTIASLHIEGEQAGGNPGLTCIDIGSQVGSVVIGGLAVRFSTFTGADYDSIFQFTGSGGSVSVGGFNMPTADGGLETPELALVDFNNQTDCTVTVGAVNPLGPLYTTTSINAGAGCQVQVGNVAGYLCPPSQYAPGVRATLNTTSTTMAAVSSANVNTGSFQAPGSGSVVVEVSLVAGLGTAADHMAFALAAHATVTPLLSNVTVFANAAALNPYTMRFLVGGLTPGTAYTLDLLFSSPDGASLTVYALGETGVTPSATGGGPVVMTVQAV